MSAANKRLHRDYEIEQQTGGMVSASFLRKDRLTRRVIPFYRLPTGRYGYDLAEVLAVCLGNHSGGQKRRQA
jgi:hypothetical protein